MNKLFILALATCVFFSCKKNTENVDAEARLIAIQDSLTTEINTLYTDSLINGFGVVIANENGTLYEKGFGFANVENQIPYSENTVQNIASVSKTFIGLALMKAVELDLLNLDDNINDYLPFDVVNPKYPNAPITLRHLATHTSSIRDNDNYDRSYVLKEEVSQDHPYYEEIMESYSLPSTHTSLASFLKNYLAKDGEWYATNAFSEEKPGAKYNYSNVAATLAAYVIELAAGKSFPAFTQEHILKPLKMTSSGWSFNAVEGQSLATLYADVETAIPTYSLITYADGGMLTSVNDMGKYLTELIKGASGNGTLLSAESYAEYFKAQLVTEQLGEQKPDNPYFDEYNSGIFMAMTPAGYFGHTGGDPGVASFMFFDPDTNIGRYIMVNTDFNSQEAVDAFFAIYDKMNAYTGRLAY